MENKNQKIASSEQHVTATLNEVNDKINKDTVLRTVCRNVCQTAIKIANYINNFEGMMTDYDGDTACITIDNNYLSDTEPFFIGNFTSDVIYVCNLNKPKYELIGIELFDVYTIVKVKV